MSIDQEELSNLQKIMDELWGEENRFAILTRRAMHTVRNSSKDFNLHADYLLVYAATRHGSVNRRTDISASRRINPRTTRMMKAMDAAPTSSIPFTHATTIRHTGTSSKTA